ncbi:MAG: hypothetical protein Ta2B_10680 [Termitinemataceae bacterium]|nr:MAG: hypothetical protein Ta2B_10680 [Termitinemataceae bacterium]
MINFENLTHEELRRELANTDVAVVVSYIRNMNDEILKEKLLEKMTEILGANYIALIREDIA